ncbi:MAG: MBL fold metallo-hydrolase [Alphaproteobacteria bacterium]|nr:MBL fold metallo-hydrolase [Alphaproteobacteria bacterium]
MAGWIRGGAIVLGGLVALVLAAWLAVLNVPSLQDALMDRAVRAQLDLNRADLFSDDALRVLICGSSSPMPDRTRAKSCTAIIAGGKFYLVDTGPEMWENIMTWRVPAERIGGVFLSHFHSDHIGELGEVNMNSWALGRPGPLKVFGGPGVERVVAGFTEAYALDSSYRTAHHGAELLDPAKGRMEAMPVRFEGPPVVTRNRTIRAFEEDGLTVTAIEVSHSPIEPAYAWRFDYKGRSVVVSGDTAYHPPLAATAKDADVLVHEAQSNEMVMRIRNAAIENGNARLAKILSDITTYHLPHDSHRGGAYRQ